MADLRKERRLRLGSRGIIFFANEEIINRNLC